MNLDSFLEKKAIELLEEKDLETTIGGGDPWRMPPGGFDASTASGMGVGLPIGWPPGWGNSNANNSSNNSGNA